MRRIWIDSIAFLEAHILSHRVIAESLTLPQSIISDYHYRHWPILLKNLLLYHSYHILSPRQISAIFS